MKVILCDDDPVALGQLVQQTHDCLERFSDEQNTLLPYGHSETLSFDLEDKARGDLYILDIDMPEPNGITLARRVRSLEPLAILFFYTSHAEFATEGYRVDARRYLIKGGNPAYFEEAIEYACKTIARKKSECLSLPFYRDTVNIPISKIMYVRRTHRQVFVYVHPADQIQTSISIGSLYKQLGSQQFVFTDRGTFVNVDYVQATGQDYIVLFNGQKLYLSQKRIGIVKQAVANYWRS